MLKESQGDCELLSKYMSSHVETNLGKLSGHQNKGLALVENENSRDGPMCYAQLKDNELVYFI